jgi:Mor family transcriptional regulator
MNRSRHRREIDGLFDVLDDYIGVRGRNRLIRALNETRNIFGTGGKASGTAASLAQQLRAAADIADELARVTAMDEQEAP